MRLRKGRKEGRKPILAGAVRLVAREKDLHTKERNGVVERSLVSEANRGRHRQERVSQ